LLRKLDELAKAEADLSNHEKRLSVIEQQVLTESTMPACEFYSSHRFFVNLCEFICRIKNLHILLTTFSLKVLF